MKKIPGENRKEEEQGKKGPKASWEQRCGEETGLRQGKRKGYNGGSSIENWKGFSLLQLRWHRRLYQWFLAKKTFYSMTRQISVTVFGVCACLECENKNVWKRKLGNVFTQKIQNIERKKTPSPWSISRLVYASNIIWSEVKMDRVMRKSWSMCNYWVDWYLQLL